MNEKDKLKRKLETSYFAIAVLVGIVLLLSASLYFCKTAHGAYLEVGAGRTQFSPSTQGTWHQYPEYEAAFENSSNAYRLIIGGNVTRYISVEGGLFNFGTHRINALYTTDYHYEKRQIGKDPTAQAYSKTDVRGYGLFLNLHHPSKYWTPYLRAGVLKLRGKYEGQYFTSSGYYEHSGYVPNQTTLGSGTCEIREYTPYAEIGLRVHSFTFGVARNVKTPTTRASDSCSMTISGITKSWFIGYQWVFK